MASSSEKYQILKTRLSQLECHFKWVPERGGQLRGLQEMEEYLLQGLTDQPYLAVDIYTLLAYIYTLSEAGKYRNLDRAKQYAQQALLEAQEPLPEDPDNKIHIGRSFVPKAFLAHLLFLEHELERCREALDQLERDWDKRSKEDEAYVKAVQAVAISRFGPQDEMSSMGKCERSLRLYREARDLHPQYPYYYLAVANMLGRLRRLDDREDPSQEEIDNIRKANTLTKSKNATILINCARVLQDMHLYCTTHDCSLKRQPEQYILKMARKAKQMGLQSNSVEVLTLCAEFFLKCWFFREEKECLDRLVKLPHRQYISLKKAGKFYWKYTKCRDIAKAKEYFKSAIEKAPGGLYFWGEMTYIDFLREQEDGYSPLSDLTSMLDKYKSQDDRAMIHLAMGDFLLSRKNKDGAQENLQTALVLDPKCKRKIKHKQRYKMKSNELLEKMADELFRGIESLLIKAWTWKTMDPPRLQDAELCYKEILRADVQNTKAVQGLSEVYHRQGQFTLAINMAEQLNEGYPGRQVQLCMSKLALAEELENRYANRQLALQHCMECITGGCKNAVALALGLLLKTSQETNCRELYEKYAECVLCLKQEDGFALDCPSYRVMTVDEVEQIVRNRLGIADPKNELFEVRQWRWEMTLQNSTVSKDMQYGIKHVLESSRESLDHMVYSLHKAHFFKCKCKSKQMVNEKCMCGFSAYYPFKFDDREDLKKKLSQKGLNNLEKKDKGKFAPLFEFIWEHSNANDPETYGWMVEWCEVVNDFKHKETFKVDNFMKMYTLAHKAAEFAEIAVTEFSKYITLHNVT